jgi:hypothetical protein
LACMLLLPSQHALAGITADEIIQQTGLAGGLCCFPRVAPGDEALAMALARRPTWVVHLRSPSADAVARIRSAAEAEGLLGRSLYVEKASGGPLPLADRLVDLLIVTDLGEADLTPELRSQWLRVLLSLCDGSVLCLGR